MNNTLSSTLSQIFLTPPYPVATSIEIMSDFWSIYGEFNPCIISLSIKKQTSLQPLNSFRPFNSLFFPNKPYMVLVMLISGYFSFAVVSCENVILSFLIFLTLSCVGELFIFV
jgi:hypothetical protein